MPKATIDDVARLAGVSTKTVSRVVNREPNVRQAMQAKVEEAIARLSYKPNQSARNLASHRSHLIGLVYEDPSANDLASSGYITRLQQGCLRACRAGNHELLIHPCHYPSKEIMPELGALIEQFRPAGIILAAPLSNIPQVVTAIEDSGTPLVRLSPGQEDGKQYSVITNDREICAEMTRYLASLGHEKIAFICGHPNHKAVGNRYLGYLDGLRDSGLAYSEQLVEQGDNSIGVGEECAVRLLTGSNPPTAIFAANDDMAAGVIRAAAKRNIRVPEQLSVAGCDDISLSLQIHPTLTTIRQPLVLMAERAALSIMKNSRNNPTPGGVEMVTGRMQIRESTGPVRA